MNSNAMLALLLMFICTVCAVNGAHVVEYRVFQVHGIPDHVGVEVKLNDGRHVLVHNRGTGNNKSGTDAEWNKTQNCGSSISCGPWRRPRYQKTVEELVAAGGQGYNVFNNNCYMARKRILEALNGRE